MKKLKMMSALTLLLFLISCGEESLTTTTQNTTLQGTDIVTTEVTTRSQMHFDKPPVDILYIVDNSGSTLASSFQQIKSQIQQTIHSVSQEFDYHIYITPLNPSPSDDINTYPLIVSDPDSFPSIASLNVVSSDSLSMFAAASGNNQEYGFQRAHTIISNNRSNGIFRNSANTIIVMISNGDDTQSYQTISGNTVYDPSIFNQAKVNFQKMTKKYSDSTFVSNPMQAESLRFISLVAHTNCNGWKTGTLYKQMSQELYNYQSFNDDNTNKDSHNLCSQNYTNLFSAVNNSIRQVIVGHRYDHWKISSQSASSIQEDDITLTRVSANGSRQNIPRSTTNGFEYLGFKSNQNTRYFPDAGEPTTGLVVRLHGTARISYPDYIIAKTRTPTEYFGFVPLPRNPDLTTIDLRINGVKYNQSTTNGWSFIGWRDVQNIKVPGPTNVSITPALNKTGYFLKLHGNAIYSNGDSIKVFYKPKAI